MLQYGQHVVMDGGMSLQFKARALLHITTVVIHATTNFSQRCAIVFTCSKVVCLRNKMGGGGGGGGEAAMFIETNPIPLHNSPWTELHPHLSFHIHTYNPTSPFSVLSCPSQHEVLITEMTYTDPISPLYRTFLCVCLLTAYFSLF